MKPNKFTESARDEECTLQIPGVCNWDKRTTVLCHLPDDSGTGKMGGKSEDWISLYGCSACHTLIDNLGEFLKTFTKEDWYFFVYRKGMVKTWRRFFEKGLIRK